MIVNIRVTPNAKRNKVIQEKDSLKIRLSAPAVDGKANSALIEVLAGHFHVKKSSVRLVKGARSRNKVVEITLL